MARREKTRNRKRRKTKTGGLKSSFSSFTQARPVRILNLRAETSSDLGDERTGKRVAKYWRQRYSLFSRYDEGISMDEEGWFSVTPEAVAARHAELCAGGATVVIDAFAGVGGNAIQFAMRGFHVVAVEIDPQRLDLARRNAEIYRARDNIDFVAGDFLRLAPSLKGDAVFLSPPWGGPQYKAIENFTLNLLKPEDGYSIFQLSQRITPNIIMFLPRSMNRRQVEELSWLSSPPLDLEIEENYVDGYLKGITACFGDLASNMIRSSSFH